jgi:hypothetical protein
LQHRGRQERRIIQHGGIGACPFIISLNFSSAFPLFRVASNIFGQSRHPYAASQKEHTLGSAIVNIIRSPHGSPARH